MTRVAAARKSANVPAATATDWVAKSTPASANAPKTRAASKIYFGSIATSSEPAAARAAFPRKPRMRST